MRSRPWVEVRFSPDDPAPGETLRVVVTLRSESLTHTSPGHRGPYR